MDDAIEITIDRDHYRCMRGSAVAVPDGYSALTRSEHRQLVWRIAASAPRRLAELAALAGLPVPWGGETTDPELLARALVEELERGAAGLTIALRHVTFITAFSGGEVEAVDLADLLPPESQAPAEAPWHWVEVEIVAPDDAPVPNMRVRVQLPDGQVRELSTDAAGVLRIDHVRDAGDCTLVFPALHGGAIEQL